MAQKLLILNGPNLSRLGVRQPDVYGVMDASTLTESCIEWASEVGLQADVRFTHDEAQMITWIHESVDAHLPVIMNPAAFTHYSYALSDAVHMVRDSGCPFVEVHISNPATREAFRHLSVISPVATGTIAGMGVYGYKLAIEAIAHLLNQQQY